MNSKSIRDALLTIVATITPVTNTTLNTAPHMPNEQANWEGYVVSVLLPTVTWKPAEVDDYIDIGAVWRIRLTSPFLSRLTAQAWEDTMLEYSDKIRQVILDNDLFETSNIQNQITVLRDYFQVPYQFNENVVYAWFLELEITSTIYKEC